VLVELAQESGIELFHTSGCSDAEAYATVTRDGHSENHRLTTKSFRRLLTCLFYQKEKKCPNSQAAIDAISVLEGKALFEGPEHSIHVRIADEDNAIWLDLCDKHWRAVRIDKHGWQVVNNPSVRFTRRRGMLPLPRPKRNGSLKDLRKFINVQSDDDFVLLLSWLVGTFRPTGPYPALGLHGEQGSAKSTTSRMLRNLIDPNIAPLRSSPKEPRDLMIAAKNSWIIAFDNFSSISPWLSDAMCRLATGGGFATRELYTDDEEKLFDAMRPLLLNGIPDLADRGDLIDRSIAITLPAIPLDKRKTERELWRAFDKKKPGILGALLDAVSTAIGRLESVKLDSIPRMADFAEWVVAAEPAFGMPDVSFLRAYESNRENLSATAIESNIIAQPLLSLLKKERRWKGSATKLLNELDRIVGEKKTVQREWPKRPNFLSRDLRRIAPIIREMGWEIELDQRDPDLPPMLVPV
jgi:hypothetical protein